jgi:hypothetical protein
MFLSLSPVPDLRLGRVFFLSPKKGFIDGVDLPFALAISGG